MKLLYTVPAIVLILQGCSPDAAEAIGLHRKFKAHAGLYGDKRNVICGDFTCEGSETGSNCPKDCFVDAYSANLDGTAEYFTCSPWTTGNTQFLSISLWYRPTAAPTATDGLVVKNSTPREFVLNHGSADASKVRFSPTTNSSNWCETDTGRLQNGVWSHVVVAFDGSQTTNAAACKIYINGTDRTSTHNGQTHTQQIVAGSAPLLIGAITSASLFSPALIDDVAIWKGVTLTSAQVTTIYNSGHPGNLNALEPRHWWKMGDDPLDEFDSTSGSKLLVDQTGRANCTPVATEGADKSATVP